MTPLLRLYRAVTTLAAPLVPLYLRHRARRSKEDPARRHERLARALPPRPPGRLVWLHGASVGESLMLHGFALRLRDAEPDLTFLFTSQTLTAATLVGDQLSAPDRQQFAPFDTPGAAARFIAHWRPDAGLFAESEIWPNLLLECQRAHIPMALVNARSTRKSLDGWARRKAAAQHLYGAFATIIAADQTTGEGLSAILDRPIPMPGNLKAALAPPASDGALPAFLLDGQPVLLAASTHAGEERLIHRAWTGLPTPRPHLVIAPRHPERAAAIRAELEAEGATIAQRSRGDIGANGTVYLADTLGEMGLWYRAASLVYLGGGHTAGIGGHNPMEPLRCGKPVISGPDLFNFNTVAPALEQTGGLTLVAGEAELTETLRGHFSGEAPRAVDQPALDTFFAQADTPMTVTLDAARALLPPAKSP
ncbi:MAG: glycosyltransferase N-terminal domain-containing protein [Pseudomonadota bacterium]